MSTHARGRTGRSLALTVPGLGRLLRDEAGEQGHRPRQLRTTDQRSDLVALDCAWEHAARLACAEDILVDLGTIRLQRSAKATAAQLNPRGIAEAIHGLEHRSEVRRVSASVRAVVRLSSERFFHRSTLRDAVNQHLSRGERGREFELWMIETSPGTLQLGVRVPQATKRQPRAAERAGALRPTVAAAMVHLTGMAQGAILDPCCGTGTILVEATKRDLGANGGDLDLSAVIAARTNGVSGVAQLDARNLPFPRSSVDAVVTNLPFGHQHRVQGSPVAWYRRTLQEMLRVAPRAVVLVPATLPFRQALGRLPATVERTTSIRLLGRGATIWVIRR